MRNNAHYLAEGAIVDSLHKLDERGRTADLKSDIHTDLIAYLSGDLEGAFGLWNIHTDGFLAIRMLSARNRSREMLHVEERRSGDLNGIDVLRIREFVVRMRASKHQLRFRAGVTQRAGECIEVALSFLELILKDVA
jgi:hypothetical protein